MATVFWDTNLFIYIFEDHPEFAERVLTIRAAMRKRGDRLLTSALAVGERNTNWSSNTRLFRKPRDHSPSIRSARSRQIPHQ